MTSVVSIRWHSERQARRFAGSLSDTAVSFVRIRRGLFGTFAANSAAITQEFSAQHTAFVRHRPRQFAAFVRRRQVNLAATGAVSSRLWFTFGVVSAQCPFTFGFAVSRFLLSVAWPTRGICSQSARTFSDNSCDQTVDIRFRQQMYSLELD